MTDPEDIIADYCTSLGDNNAVSQRVVDQVRALGVERDELRDAVKKIDEKAIELSKQLYMDQHGEHRHADHISWLARAALEPKP